MSLGAVFRQARMRSGLSQRELASRAGVSSSVVTRLERDRANPTWQTIARLAAVLEHRPQLHLVPDSSAVGAAAKLANDRPIERPRKQHVNVLGALSSLEQCAVPFVVAGAVAALLQGFPTPADYLRVLVHDTDEAMATLERVLLAEQLLFDEMEPDELRAIVPRSWPIGDCEVLITLVPELPSSVTVELLADFVVQVLPPEALLADEEVASMLGVVAVRSSEL